MEHLSWPTSSPYADDRSTVVRTARAIFCEIFSRHHFPVRCVTFYTRACGRIYIVYSAKQLFPRERDYFCADLIFDTGFINTRRLPFDYCCCVFMLFAHLHAVTTHVAITNVSSYKTRQETSRSVGEIIKTHLFVKTRDNCFLRRNILLSLLRCSR